MHHIRIQNLGPIQSCEMDIDQFTILTGPQASGKSTVAKAVYFFRTIKDEIFDECIDRSLQHSDTMNGLIDAIYLRLKNKFSHIFGTAWTLAEDMMVEYEYAPHVSIRLQMLDDGIHFQNDNNQLSYWYGAVNCVFSDALMNSLLSLFGNLPVSEYNSRLRNALSEIFHDEYETIFIPAGRSMITLLTDQLSYIFTKLNDAQRRTIDYCTQKYVEKILSLKPMFSGGMERCYFDHVNMGITDIREEEVFKFIDLVQKILKGRYVYSGNEERLMLNDEKFVKINYASSGQQETVWLFNILFWYLVEGSPVNVILEEPEAHLYPDSQKYIADILALFIGTGNHIVVTTHSPYVLAEFNNLLYANEVPEAKKEKVNDIIDSDMLLPYQNTRAYYVNDGSIHDGMEAHPGLIRNELIDGASLVINENTDRIMDLIWNEDSEL